MTSFPCQVKEFARRAWSLTDLVDTLDEMTAPRAEFHIGSRPMVHTLDEFKDLVRAIKSGQPDLSYQIQDMVAENDLVAARMVFTGTHSGWLAGVFPPSGRVLRLTELVLVRLDQHGRLVTLWQESDFYGLLVQAGVLAPPGASKPRQAGTALRNVVRAVRRPRSRTPAAPVDPSRPAVR